MTRSRKAGRRGAPLPGSGQCGAAVSGAEITDEDARLLTNARAAAAGDAAALARVVPVLYCLAGQVLGARMRGVDPDDLADLASDGVVKAVEHLHAARPASAAMFRAWVRSVVWRTALDAQRTRGRRDAAWRAARLAEDVDGGDVATNGAASGGADPEAGSWAASVDPATDDPTAETALAALARLAVDAQRELPAGAAFVLWAHLVTGAGWAEVAVLVGTTPAGAKRRYQRALAVLRAAVWRGAPDLPPAVRAAALARLVALDPRGGRGA